LRAPIPTGLVGPVGYEAWEHLAMWCPQTLERLAKTEASLALHFWRLDRRARRQIKTVAADLCRRHPQRPAAQLEIQARRLVRSEWVTLPKEVDVPVWEPEPVMDVETGLWKRWEWPGIDSGRGWANEILVELSDRHLSRQEFWGAVGLPPVQDLALEAAMEPMPATKAETDLWETWENSDFENLMESMQATVTTEWDRSMVAWHLAVTMETLNTPERVRTLALTVSRRALRLPTPPHQPPVVPAPFVLEP